MSYDCLYHPDAERVKIHPLCQISKNPPQLITVYVIVMPNE